MVIDTSAIAAILFAEADQARFVEAIEAAPVCLISAVTRVELACVVEGRKGEAGRALLEEFLRAAAIETVSVTVAQAEIAIEAFRRFGRGRHPAALNLGDCFSYALARFRNDALLFKGDDFGRTDLPAIV
jgi:ribonuclease VapC